MYSGAWVLNAVREMVMTPVRAGSTGRKWQPLSPLVVKHPQARMRTPASNTVHPLQAV